jgi:hypothetical protein
MVLELQDEHTSQWAAIGSISSKIGDIGLAVVLGRSGLPGSKR